MKISMFLIIVAFTAMAVSIKPVLVDLQQTKNCNLEKINEKGLIPTNLDMCLCEQQSSKISPRYETSNSAYGIKFSRKLSNSSRPGVAASRGVIERTQSTKLLGKLEIPNIDDSNSPEVAALREQLSKNRDETRKYVEYWYKSFSKRTRLKIVTCDPPAANCPGKFVEAPLPGKTQNENYRVINENYRARVFNQYYDLQNTSEWQRLPKFDWRTRGLDVGQVMNQGNCGSCWAFASVSAYQSAYNLEKMRMGYGVIDMFHPPEWTLERQPSVQQLLNCISKEKGDCDGGWHGSAFAFMVNNHVPHIPDRLVFYQPDKTAIEEYTGRKSICTSPFLNRKVPRGGEHTPPRSMIGSVSNPKLADDGDTKMTASDRALAWGYVNEEPGEKDERELLLRWIY